MKILHLFESRNKLYWIILIPLWGLFFGLILQQLFAIDFWQAMLESSIASGLLLVSAVASLNILRFYNPSVDRLLFITGLSVILSFAVIFLNSVIMRQVNNWLDLESIHQQSQYMLGGFAFLINAFSLGFSLQLTDISEAQELKENRDRAESLNKEAELLKLRHQLQPHFLFNSLNSINALITIQPQEARKMVQQLSAFLRGTIRADEHNLVSIKDELAHLELYLKIEKVRFGHRLSTVIDEDDESASKQIPSLLLQPLMENAIKFGLYGTTDLVEIKLEIKYSNHLLQISISNPIDIDVKTQAGTGFGLSSIQRRLYLLYGRTDLLQTHKTDNLFTAQLKIPQQS